MATVSKDDLRAMTIDERFALMEDIRETMHEALEEAGPPDWHRAIVEERLADAERNPEASIPWEQVRQELRKKWLS